MFEVRLPFKACLVTCQMQGSGSLGRIPPDFFGGKLGELQAISNVQAEFELFWGGVPFKRCIYSTYI